MKYFSKLLSMLLVGVVLVSTACTDYADDIANTNERLEEVQADVEGILELLDKIECEHGDALDAIIAGHCDDLAGLAEDIADANDEILALKGVDADLKKSIEFINTLLKELAGEQDEEKLLSAMATWNALFDGLKVFYETQLEGLLSDVEAAKAFMAAINETLSAYKATYSQKVGMGAVVEDLETVIAKFQALEKEFAQYKEDTAVEFSKVYAAIASLGSVQSIVYVPEYSDGCATINYALINNMIVEARSTMEFMVTPASGAGKIVSMWTENPEVLAIVHEDLKERLNTRSAEHLFNVAKVYVKNGEPDRLMVEFDTRHLDPAFYAREKSLALSLVYNAGNEGDVTSEANVASCFVKTIATTKPEVLKIDLVDAAKKFVTNTLVETHVIQYTNEARGEQVIPVTLADMHKVAFYAEGFEKEYRTFEEMVAAGYDLTLVNDVKPTDKAGYKKDFTNCVGVVKNTDEPLVITDEYTDGAHTYHKSEIAKNCQKKDYVGFVGTYKYNYIVESNYYKYDPAVTLDAETNDLTADAFYVESEVKIGKKAAIIPIKLDDIVWEYYQDVAVDALGETDGWYSRTKIALPTLPSEKGNAPTALPDDVEHHMILADDLFEATSTTFYYIDCKDGLKKTVPGSEAVIYHEVGNPCNHNQSACHYFLDINKFKWETWAHNVADGNVERDYTIEILYSTEAVEVVYQISVKTIDRCRKPQTVTYNDLVEIVYHSDLSFDYNGHNDVLSKIYDVRVPESQKKHYINAERKEMGAVAYLNDIFKAHDYVVSANNVDDKAFDKSKLVFDLNDFSFSVIYDYTEKVGVANNIVDDVLNYSKTFTTWYGQEYTITKNVDFKTPDYLYAGITPEFVYNDAAGNWYSDARPYYSPEQPDNFVYGDVTGWPLTDLSIERVNMFAAFDLQKSHGAVVELPFFNHEKIQSDDRENVFENPYSCSDWDILPYNSEKVKVTTRATADSADYVEQDVNIYNYTDANGNTGLYEDSNMVMDAAGDWWYEYADEVRPEFMIDTKEEYDSAHTFFNDEKYALTYYGSDDKIGVGSDLYIINADGTKYRVESNFDNNFANVYEASCDDYSNYFVKQYNPLGALTTVNSEYVKYVSASDKPYAIYLCETAMFSLKDKRGAQLININGDEDAAGNINFLITGNGTNGFAEGVYAGWAFGFPEISGKPNFDYCGHIAAGSRVPNEGRKFVDIKFDIDSDNVKTELHKFFRFDEVNGVIYFDYSGEIVLQEPISIPVKVTLVSSWNCTKPEEATGTVVIRHKPIL